MSLRKKMPKSNRKPLGSNLTPLENFCLSSLAAITSTTAAAPFHTAKLLKQLSTTLSETDDFPLFLSNKSNYPLLLLYQLFKEKGFSSLFAGNGYGCLRYFPTQALNFILKERVKQYWRVSGNSGFWRKLYLNIMAGGTVGIISLAFVYPLDTYGTIAGIDIDGQYKSGQKKIAWSQLYAGKCSSII